MHLKSYVTAALYGLPALANAVPSPSHSQTASPSPSATGSNADHFKSYTIKAENITAKLIPYGARLTSLLVPDRDGNVQDVVVGYDDPKEYLHDSETNRTFFGAVVGRYANRIKNGTFTIDDNTYHSPSHSESSITFTLLDQGFEKFPGDVITHATFSVSTEKTQSNPKGLPQLTSKLVALSLTEKTPIMLANHIYWNLNAFKESNVLKDTTLQLPLSQRFVGGDSILIPNGTIHDVENTYQGALDFTSPKLIGKDIEKTYDLCGAGCTGYDTCFLVDRPSTYASNSLATVLSASSSSTGISLDVATNQAALQIYTCSGQNGSIATKKSQAKRNKDDGGDAGATHVNKYGCFVVETEDWIDGINNPGWGRIPYEVFGPDDGPAVNWATYQFGTI
ncbi:hypothetical protein HAV15_011646 [Penicillium sp. str. |nr:hypothetical protein HAV15_011646 [Penicillium sp. str. \